MVTKTKKPAAKSAASKAKPKAKPKAIVERVPEVWVCTISGGGWVKRHGRKYTFGETILVFPDRIPAADLERLRKYFEPKPMEIMTVVSEPVELLDEGEYHGSNSK